MKHVTGCWRKDLPCYRVAKNLAGLRSCALWKVEFASDELGYLGKLSKQSVEGLTRFLLTAYGKIQEERDILK